MMVNRPSRGPLYPARMPATWWLRKRSYLFFMLRELSSVFIALFLVLFMVELYWAEQGTGAAGAFVKLLSAPGWLLFHAVALAFAVYHSVTWFYTTSIVMPLRLKGRELPRWLFTGMNIVLWLAISGGVWVLYGALRRWP